MLLNTLWSASGSSPPGTAEGCTGLRHLLLEEASVERFYAFENRKKIFPIDSRYKFVSLVFRKKDIEDIGNSFSALLAG